MNDQSRLKKPPNTLLTSPLAVACLVLPQQLGRCSWLEPTPWHDKVFSGTGLAIHTPAKPQHEYGTAANQNVLDQIRIRRKATVRLFSSELRKRGPEMPRLQWQLTMPGVRATARPQPGFAGVYPRQTTGRRGLRSETIVRPPEKSREKRMRPWHFAKSTQELADHVGAMVCNNGATGRAVRGQRCVERAQSELRTVCRVEHLRDM